jgi:hypothetical protein
MAEIVLYIIILLFISPYVRKSDDRLQLMAQTEIFLLVLVGFINETNVEDTEVFTDVTVSVLMVLITSGFLLYFIISSSNVHFHAHPVIVSSLNTSHFFFNFLFLSGCLEEVSSLETYRNPTGNSKFCSVCETG